MADIHFDFTLSNFWLITYIFFALFLWFAMGHQFSLLSMPEIFPLGSPSLIPLICDEIHMPNPSWIILQGDTQYILYFHLLSPRPLCPASNCISMGGGSMGSFKLHVHNRTLDSRVKKWLFLYSSPIVSHKPRSHSQFKSLPREILGRGVGDLSGGYVPCEVDPDILQGFLWTSHVIVFFKVSGTFWVLQLWS